MQIYKLFLTYFASPALFSDSDDEVSNLPHETNRETDGYNHHHDETDNRKDF